MREGTGTEPRREQRPPTWTGYTPAGQHLVVEREDDGWVVSCDSREPVRHHLLDVALIEAIRSDVQAHWGEVDHAAWTRLTADSILSTWRQQV